MQGGSLGAAMTLWHDYLNKPRTISTKSDMQKGSYLGPSYGEEYLLNYFNKNNIPAKKLKLNEIASVTAKLIADEKVIGWFQNRMEFGPRALGSRSIIGDPRSPAMQKKMNLKIKYRESFRPFAPSVLSERVSDFFDIDRGSPYMLLVADVKSELQKKMTEEEERLFGIAKLNIVRSEIPAVTHVDYSARIQTVHRETNELYWQLIKEFELLTGYPIIINTSFNVRGEPIVNSPEDAYRCFMRTEMDYLVMGNFLLDKTEQPSIQRER